MLKSAILAAKKKNNDIESDVIFLTGEELSSVNISNKNAQVKGQVNNKRTERKIQEVEVKIEKTPSLKETIKKINTIGKEHVVEKDLNNNAEETIKVNQYTSEFSQEKLEDFYSKFIGKIKAEEPRLASAMNSQKPLLLEENSIELYFQTNAVLEEFRMRLKPNLLSFLKTSLNNEAIIIVEKVIEQEMMERPSLYSDNEKFQMLAEKNPALLKLKNIFNLDFE